MLEMNSLADLVFDMADLNWSTGQFCTLYLSDYIFLRISLLNVFLQLRPK